MDNESKSEILGEAVYSKIEEGVSDAVDHMSNFSMEADDMQYAFDAGIQEV